MNENAGQQNKASFCEWFDPHDINHIKAYNHLQRTGAWPKGFKPDNIYLEAGWQHVLAFDLANHWIQYKLTRD